MITSSVDAFHPESFLKENGLAPRDVALVVWGSPFMDTTSDPKSSMLGLPPHMLTKSEQIDQHTWGYLSSGDVKTIIFRHLQEAFPSAVIIITCVYCNLRLELPRWWKCEEIDASSSDDNILMTSSPQISETTRRVLLLGQGYVPMIDGLQYTPCFANGYPRTGGNLDHESLRIAIAIPEVLMGKLRKNIFSTHGHIDLYGIIHATYVSTCLVRQYQQKQAHLFLGEGNAVLSRCAAAYVSSCMQKDKDTMVTS